MLTEFIVRGVRFYQRILSPDQGMLRKFLGLRGTYCTMYPSCSEYMILAVRKYGPIKGILKGVRRVLQCHPYQKKLVDFP
jgi:putative membrane protein insertion efficiency factor